MASFQSFRDQLTLPLTHIRIREIAVHLRDCRSLAWDCHVITKMFFRVRNSHALQHTPVAHVSVHDTAMLISRHPLRQDFLLFHKKLAPVRVPLEHQ